MKKLSLFFVYCISLKVYALPLGNPSEPILHEPTITYQICLPCHETYHDTLSFGIGFYGDYVFERHMETTTHHDIDHTNLITNAAYLVASVNDGWDFFATLGGTKLCFNTSLGAFDPNNAHPRFDLETSTRFSWSVGSRTTLLEYGRYAFGLEGQYFKTNANLARLAIRTNVDLYADEDIVPYSEWQIGAGLSRKTSIFVPYLGIKYSRAFWDLGPRTIQVAQPVTLVSLRNQQNWGYVVGVSLDPCECENMIFTAEGRFGDEKALYVNGQIRF